ncbi:MAG: hypothetical protein NTX03_14670 [Bacteroidetes bacterium]|nr:hypothetical protein [Bacteroidota bacterium]
MKSEFYIRQLDNVLKEYETFLSNHQYDTSSDGYTEDSSGLRAMMKGAVMRITGKDSHYTKGVFKALEVTYADRHVFQTSIGILKALRTELENGYFKSISEIIQAEIFSDYLEMAEYLIEGSYIDAAAVIVGSTLEAHLKELCKLNNIDIEIDNGKGKKIPKKAEQMNVDLCKNDSYPKTYQIQITAWLSIRNSAAHANYKDYSSDQVKNMLFGVRQFILTSHQ